MIDLIILRLKILICSLLNKSSYNLGRLGNKNIFIFLGADYGNLGDVAITYAQIKYLRERYSDYNVIELPISQTAIGIKAVKSVINKDDVVALIGGGNTSDLYDDIEWLRQLVILNFRNHRIVAFPQTFDFSNTRRGKICKWIARSIYRKAKYFTLLAREQNTMNVLKEDFKGIDAQIAPDIVMTLDERKQSVRKGVLICMRSDKEKVVSNQTQKQLVERLHEKYGDVTYQDTQVDDVNMDNRYERLQDIMNKFRTHQMVVTDRLHGMILCFITGTPALVFDNSNHKISACYRWIKDCGYIKLFQSLDDIDNFLPLDNFESTHQNILKQYNDLTCLKFR